MGRIYIGKAEDDLIRTAQYVLRYQHTSDEDSSLLYRHCKAANRVFHFPLVESAEDDSSSRALGEALWCAVLGTYQLKDDYLAIRRDYGLANVGEEVIGTNSTTCMDKPARWASAPEGQSGVLDRRYLALKRQLCLAANRLAFALLNGEEPTTATCKAQMLLLQEALRSRVSSLLLSGTLLYRPSAKSDQFMLGARLDRCFTTSLPKDTWVVRLREDAETSSILGPVEEERPLFAGVALQFKAEGSSDEWRIYQPVGGSRGQEPRRFAFRLFSYLPATSQQARRAQAATSALTMQQRRPGHYDQLSNAAKAAFDGHCYLSRSLRWYDGQAYYGSGEYGLKIVGQTTHQITTARTLLFEAIGVDDDEYQGATPCRFRIREGASSFEDSPYRPANPRHQIEVLTHQGSWIPLPFKILAKGGTKESPTDQLVRIFEELENQASPSLQVPGLFAPKQRSIQRATALGQANLDIWGRPAMRLVFDSALMAQVFPGG